MAFILVHLIECQRMEELHRNVRHLIFIYLSFIEKLELYNLTCRLP